MLYPEEKMAVKLLARHKLTPPYDLLDLVSKYGDVEFVEFPMRADGVTVGIGQRDRPAILINSNTPQLRQNFTLAHELGHIIIPWHTGTIVSHETRKSDSYEYGVMESEANRFAAELLMPSDWILESFNAISSFQEFVRYILEHSKASRDAALIKIFNVLPQSIVCARVDLDGSLINAYRTTSAPFHNSLRELNLLGDDVFRAPHSRYQFSLGDYYYVAWVFERVTIEEVDQRPWRDLLNIILGETERRDRWGSINSILSAAYRKHEHKFESEICSGILQSFDGREELAEVIEHPLFQQFVIKRVRDLQARG